MGPMRIPDNTPVLAGIGTATQREEDFLRAREPMDLMHAAVAAAGRDSGSVAALAGLGHIAVPRGRWTYRNPAGEIARRVGASDATTVLASVGVLQQSLIGEACARIARGEIHTALVAGADTGYRLLRAQIAGVTACERVQDDEPDIFLAPTEDLRHPVERRCGLHMPVGLYAILESAWRARHGWSVAQHRDRLADLQAQCARIAAANPHAWHRQAMPAAAIRDASQHNPMQAFPYTRAHCSTWNVDQAAALLLCSAARAHELGIPRERWVFALASTESNHMVAVSARAQLADCPGARIAGQAALEAAGIDAGDLDLVDLYSCFPLALEVYADAMGLPPGRALTVTGGMAFAGGPYNNYMLQSTCRVAEQLRAGQGRTALVSGVSGVLTKQGFGLWSVDPPPRGFQHADVSALTASNMPVCEVLEHYSGPASVAGYTVLHGRGQMPRAVALFDTPQGQRAMATTEDPAWAVRMQEEEWVGRVLQIDADRIAPLP